MARAVRLYENMRAVFYAPFYVAHEIDAYGREGLNVEMVTSASPAQTASALLQGDADVSWGGPMRVLLTYDQDPDCDLVLFAEAVGKDPFFLVGRQERPEFEFADLFGIRVAVVSEVATPWLCLQQDIRLAGLDPSAINTEPPRSMARNTELLRSGAIDVVQLFQPFVEDLIRTGAHIWYAGAVRGPTAYTSFYTTRARFGSDQEMIAGMTRGLHRALTWLHAADPMDAAAAIAGYFPDLLPDLLAACIERYQSLEVWNRTPVLDPTGFERLKASCLAGELFKRNTPFTDCVDNRFADQSAQDLSSGTKGPEE
jgi:NitT/TauT family transport system substrate-binding protein